jgi:hypothetical protein
LRPVKSTLTGSSDGADINFTSSRSPQTLCSNALQFKHHSAVKIMTTVLRSSNARFNCCGV